MHTYTLGDVIAALFLGIGIVLVPLGGGLQALAVPIVFATLGGTWAHRKGLRSVVWGTLAFYFGVIALAILAFRKARRDEMRDAVRHLYSMEVS